MNITSFKVISRQSNIKMLLFANEELGIKVYLKQLFVKIFFIMFNYHITKERQFYNIFKDEYLLYAYTINSLIAKIKYASAPLPWFRQEI